jgi:hypothetical protein
VSRIHDHNKALIAALRRALYAGKTAERLAAIDAYFAPDAKIRLGHPFQEVDGPRDLWARVYAPLLEAMPDMERRDFIVMAGPRWGEDKTGDWVGLGGNIIGTLSAPWLGIPTSDHPVHMRYHEYLRLKDGKIVEMEGLWDIPHLMVQQGVWPMAPQRGVDWMCLGPADGTGILNAPHDAQHAQASVQRIWDMLHDLKQGTADTPERGLGRFWHPSALWHGPAGLGTARGHLGISQKIFKQFRDGLSNNTRHLERGVFFGDQNLVAFTGWPSGTAVHSGDRFLGLAPTGKTITRRSLDFWRLEHSLVRECWVMVDMLDLYRQLGIDILSNLPNAQEAAA